MLDIAAIQRTLAAEGLDGWLLYDFHGSNPIAVKLVGNTGNVFGSRYQLATLVRSAAGLVPGASVQLAGQTVGQVDRIELIRQLASNLDDNDAFTIFPEGGNFTHSRRARSIRWLRAEGRTRRAESAERMRHVLAPRQAGTAAALQVSPDADIAIVAHTGLEHLTSAKAMWRYMPMDTTIKVHWWRIPAQEAPAHPDAVGDWLFGWWSLIDGWVEANRPAIVDEALADPSTETDPIAP